MPEPTTFALLIKLYRIANLSGLILDREDAENEARNSQSPDDVRVHDGTPGREA
jgi:hypothetical protein